MTTHRSFDLVGVVGGLMLLAGLLAPGAHPLGAQEAGAAADSTPLELVFVVFPEPAGASDALAAMSDTQRQSLESYAVVGKDKEGNVKVQEKKDKAGASQNTKDARKAVDGVVALLGQAPQDRQAQPQPGGALPVGLCLPAILL